MNHLPVCAEQVVHWPYCLDFPSHILDRFFLISSTQKGILFVLLSPSSNILADKPQLAQSLFWYDLCPFASTTGAMTFRWTKIPPSFEIWWSHYFRRILFPGKLSKGNCSLCFFEFFSSHHAKGYRTLRGKRWHFRILRKKYSMLSELPLLQFILPKVHRSKTMPFKQSSLKLINCMLDLIQVREVKREKWLSRRNATRFLEITNRKESRNILFWFAISRVL